MKTRIESGTNQGPVFSRDAAGRVSTRPFQPAEPTPEIQPWEEPVGDLALTFVGPAPLRDPMEVSR